MEFAIIINNKYKRVTAGAFPDNPKVLSFMTLNDLQSFE